MDITKKCGWIKYYFLLFLICGVQAVKDVKTVIPQLVRAGESVTLTCLYTLEKGPLYRIKWYLDEQEFYQYVPKANPPRNSYVIRTGMNINESLSDSSDVTLVNISTAMTGYYKCEITEEYPSYHTAITGAKMEVADVPDEKPTLILPRDRLSPGDILKANCTSGVAHPAPDIIWKINDKLINETVTFEKIFSGNDGKVKMSSEVELQLTNNHFREGKLRLDCTVMIRDLYTSTSEAVITEDKPLIASIKGDAAPHSDRTNGGQAVMPAAEPRGYQGKGFCLAVSIFLIADLYR